MGEEEPRMKSLFKLLVTLESPFIAVAVETTAETAPCDLPTGIVGHLRWRRRRITVNGIFNI